MPFGLLVAFVNVDGVAQRLKSVERYSHRKNKIYLAKCWAFRYYSRNGINGIDKEVEILEGEKQPQICAKAYK